MNLRFPAGMLFPAFLILCLTGCYDRWTGNYDQVPELASKRSAIIAESELSKEEKKEQQKLLMQIAKEKEPVYTISGGDKLEIVVYNHSDLSVKTTVTPDGYVGLVLVGQVKISGLTLGQAAKKIEEAFSKYIRNPKVGLSPTEVVSETVSIAGAVTHPGIYTIYNGMRLADLFAKAGGAVSHHYDGQAMDAADYTHSLFIRNNKTIPVDFIRAIQKGDPLHNITLRRGDYIYISPRGNALVYLIGEVKNPGRHVWTPELGLLELLTIGGWVSETRWHHVILIRGGMNNPKMYKIDLDGILRGNFANVPLKSGDIVYVPKDNISEYNVFVRKLLPTGQLINMIITPASWISSGL